MKLLVFCCLIFSLSFSQTNVDSLKRSLKNSKETELRGLMAQIATYYINEGNMDSSQIYFRWLLDDAIILQNDTLMGTSYLNLGVAHMLKDQFKMAIEYFDSATVYANKLNDKSLHATILSNRGIIYNTNGLHREEIKIYNQALEISTEINDSLQMAITLGNIAEAYYKMSYHETALEYILKSIAISKNINDQIGIAYMYRLMGADLEKMKTTNKALEYLNMAAEIFKTEETYYEEAKTYLEISRIHINKNKFTEAGNYINKANTIYNALNQKNGKAEADHILTEFFIAKQEYERAFFFANRALAYQTSVDNYLEIGHIFLLIIDINIHLKNYSEARLNLNKTKALIEPMQSFLMFEKFYSLNSDYFEAIGDYKNSLANHKLYMANRDSIYKSESLAKIADQQIKYEVEKKEKENQLLLAENKLKTAAVEKQTAIRNFSILLAMVLMISGFILYNRYRTKIKLNNELKNLNATKDKFFTIISHDLKNPIFTLSAYIDMMVSEFDEIDKYEQQKYLHTIQSTVKHTFDLLENLLNWSRTQRDKIQINPEKIAVSKIIDDTFHLIAQNASDKKIMLINSVRPELFVTADKITLTTVLRNLISNAIKFTYPGGRVEIHATESNGKLKIIVEDNGVGIGAEKIGKLFKIDYHNTTPGTAKEKGTGLGLILCKEFIEKNGGSISVESEVGKGSRFIIILNSNN